MNDLDWRIIVTMYNLKNLTQTAEKLFMSQPTLTKRLQKIEYELNVSIAVRNKKGVTFTPEGEYLAKQGEKILKLFDETTKGLASITGRTKKILRVGATNAFSRFFLPTILQKSKEFDNNIEFQITTDYSNKVVKLLQHDELDVGFIFGDIPFDGYKYNLGKNDAVIAYSKPFTLNDLPNMNRIEYSKDAFTTKLIDSWWHEHFTSEAHISMIATNGDTCREMVLNGLGYAIFTVKEFVINDDRLYKLPMTNIDGSPVTRNMWLIYSSNYKTNKTLDSFINSIKSTTQKL
jgi:DNA-binding transcriptional LysR family regulator